MTASASPRLASSCVYRHDWTVGDLVLWDGIGTLHRRDSFDPSTRRYLRGLCTLLKDEAGHEDAVLVTPANSP